ncbi:MAG: methyltransferase domain-containing protein [Candidatus Micrarchaeota archaeon]
MPRKIIPPTEKDTAAAVSAARYAVRHPETYERFYTRRGFLGVSLEHRVNVKKKIAALIKVNNGKTVRILDVGCGSGEFVKQAKKTFGDAVELHALDVARWPEWRGIKGVNFRIGHAENLERSFEPNYFDMVISTFGLCRTPNQLKALEQVQKVARENGLVITHVDDSVLKKRQNTNVKKIAEALGARVTHFQLAFTPMYSIQFRRKPESVKLEAN